MSLMLKAKGNVVPSKEHSQGNKGKEERHIEKPNLETPGISAFTR